MDNRYLFRGKRVDDGEWVYGNLGYFHSISGKRRLEIHCQIPRNHTYWNEITPESVSQCTGLYAAKSYRGDSDDARLVFEGDILDCGDRIVKVRWHNQCGAWDSEFIKYIRELCSNGISPAEWKYRANIIGTIHDNPELLKEV